MPYPDLSIIFKIEKSAFHCGGIFVFVAGWPDSRYLNIIKIASDLIINWFIG